jgi:hypothetical protein
VLGMWATFFKLLILEVVRNWRIVGVWKCCLQFEGYRKAVRDLF